MMIRAVSCSCGWGLLVDHLELGPVALVKVGGNVEVMIDHWRGGHQLRAMEEFRNVIAFNARRVARGQRAVTVR